MKPTLAEALAEWRERNERAARCGEERELAPPGPASGYWASPRLGILVSRDLRLVAVYSHEVAGAYVFRTYKAVRGSRNPFGDENGAPIGTHETLLVSVGGLPSRAMVASRHPELYDEGP